MGEPPWAAEARLDTLLGRKEHEAELNERMALWTQGFDAWELMSWLQEAGVPAGVVQDCRDLYQDPQLQHRGHYQYLEHPEMGTYATDRSEFLLSDTPGVLDRPAPMLGQHTEMVLREVFRLSEEEYRVLAEAGVLE